MCREVSDGKAGHVGWVAVCGYTAWERAVTEGVEVLRKEGDGVLCQQLAVSVHASAAFTVMWLPAVSPCSHMFACMFPVVVCVVPVIVCHSAVHDLL